MENEDLKLTLTDNPCGTEENPHIGSMDADKHFPTNLEDGNYSMQCERCGETMLVSSTTVRRITFEAVDCQLYNVPKR